MPARRNLFRCLCLMALLWTAEAAADAPFDRKAALAASQAAIGRALAEASFTDSRGRNVRIAELMDKPLVISLIYTSCADVCPMVSETLARAVEIARESLGRDSFRVVSIGFDARNDTPNRMRMYAASHGFRLDNWTFLSGDGATIDRFAADLGFTFRPSPQGFDHMAQTTVIDQQGRVYRHIYGADFTPPLLVEPLKQLIFGQRIDMVSIEGLINRVRLFCTVYDPASGKYKFDYSLFIGIVLGGLSLGLVGTVAVRAWIGLRRPSRPA